MSLRGGAKPRRGALSAKREEVLLGCNPHPHTAVCRRKCHKEERIATPVCALVRNDVII